jgi:hypothetical protein
MTTGSVDSGGTAAACSGSLLCAIGRVLSVFVFELATTLTAGTDKFSSSPFLPLMTRLRLGPRRGPHLCRRDAPRENPGGVGAST